MTMRSSKTVTFRKSFFLGRPKQGFPPGDYLIETGEELQEGVSFPIFKQRRTVIYLHQASINPEHSKVMLIDPRELEDALHNDRTGISAEDVTFRSPSPNATVSD